MVTTEQHDRWHNILNRDPECGDCAMAILEDLYDRLDRNDRDFVRRDTDLRKQIREHLLKWNL